MPSLNPDQFGSDEMISSRQLMEWSDPEIDTSMAGRDKVDRLIDSMREHGYRPEMADEPIQVVRHGDRGAVVEGRHRAVAGYHAGIKEMPAIVVEKTDA